jgi:phosphomannomutase / phosphoglucomutase
MAHPAHVFRQYDIRGIVGTDLDADLARAVGQGYATSLRRAVPHRTPRVATGHDNRPSSPVLAAALIDGLRAGGVDVMDLGTVPTPLVYWAEKTLGTDGGVQVTGSHNPSDWNGIKMSIQGRPFWGGAIQELREWILTGAMATGEGRLERVSITDRYIQDIAGRFDLPRTLKVVVDCGNGSGSLVAVPLLEALGCEVVPLFCESDGTFPNHHPDPTVDENLVDLIRTVRETGADVGIGFDGDADRIGAVDDTGAVVRGDILLLLFGLDILRRRGPGQKLVFDVKCSQVLPEVFAAAGGEPIMWKTGHSIMKEKMREVGAPLAGELSGHICFADEYFGFDDALYDACRLVELLARSDRPLSAMVDAFPRFLSTPEIRIHVTEETKWRVVDAALEHFRNTHDVIDVDGVRIQFGDGWGLIRASNTQPVLVARYEARTADRLAEIRLEVEDWLRAQGVDV